jgi:hypothetical protein
VNPAECEDTAGDLARWFCEQVWAEMPGPYTAGVQYEVIGGDEDDTDEEAAVVLRRLPDGQVFDVDLQVTVTPHRPARSVDEPLPLEPAP